MRRIACEIRAEVKLRNGYDMYWCRAHGHRAWAPGGGPLHACALADVELPDDMDVPVVQSARYPGGVGIWGAVYPVFNSTNLPLTSGVHVHARLLPDGAKEIDRTFPEVAIEGPDGRVVRISETAARAYVATAIVNGSAIELQCPRCGFHHIDKGWFSVNPHRKHQCNQCGRSFYAKDISIGNPVVLAQQLLGDDARPIQVRSEAALELTELATIATGGVQVWASNPAIIWTVPRSEQSGIHVHAYEYGNPTPLLDETFGLVTIEGEPLDDRAVRLLMAQMKLGYLDRKLAAEICPKCGSMHFDDASPWCVKPHREHLCAACGGTFEVPRPTVSNPAVAALPRLEALFPKVDAPEASQVRRGLRGATFRRVPPPAAPDPSRPPLLCKKSQHRP